MDDKYIVCYMDILGYKQLVEKCSVNIKKIKLVENTIRNALDMIDGFQHRKTVNKYSVANKKLLKHINFRIISDTVLITMPLSHLPFLHSKYKENENILACIKLFFCYASLFYLHVSGLLGYYFRGGICIGQHYENKLNRIENIFILSQAITDASDLEKRANSPRILIGNSVNKYICDIDNRGLSNSLFSTCIFKDIDGLYCLDIYHPLKNDSKTKRLLEDIVKGIKFQLKLNSKNPEVIMKYCCFAKYHNKKLSDKLNFPALLINDFDNC